MAAQEESLEADFSRISQQLIDLQAEKNELHKEKDEVEEEARNTYTLYELTREITKIPNDKEALKVFKNMLDDHVQFDSCEMFEDMPKTTKPDDFVFPLISKRRKMGYLLIKGSNERDLEKVLILGHQYALALRRIKLYQDIEKIAITDGLTELYTRRYFEERFQEEIKRSLRRNIKMALLMIDVDYFKKINDTYSHLTGDQVLHSIAEIIKENIRGIDVAGRYGGEEFSVVLPDTDQEGAYYAAERIRRAVEDAIIRAYDSELRVTVSIGLATFPKDGRNMEDLIDHADTALYQAKNKGRNRVVIYGKGASK